MATITCASGVQYVACVHDQRKSIVILDAQQIHDRFNQSPDTLNVQVRSVTGMRIMFAAKLPH